MEPLLIVLDELKIRFRDASFNLFGLHPSEPPKGFAEGHVESKHGFEFLAALIHLRPLWQVATWVVPGPYKAVVSLTCPQP